MITDVKIFDPEKYSTLFETLSPIQINVRDERRATSFPVESGETRSDHVVVQPVEIGMDVILSGDMSNSFSALQQAYAKNQLLGIQTRARVYQPMLLVNFYHDESAEMADAIKLSLRFTEWRTVTPEYGALPPRSVAKKGQAGTVKRGNVQTKEVPSERKRSWLDRIFGD